jgi:acyl dehydratase
MFRKSFYSSVGASSLWAPLGGVYANQTPRPARKGLVGLEPGERECTVSRDPLFLDDLHVGQRFTTEAHEVDDRQIVEFARQFDPQPFHTDSEAAKQSLFGGLVASGWHTAAITMRLQVTSGMPIAGGLVGLGGELAWPKPTRPGDVLHVESEIVSIVPSRSKPRGVVMFRSETRNQRGEVVQTTTVRLLVPRRSTS